MTMTTRVAWDELIFLRDETAKRSQEIAALKAECERAKDWPVELARVTGLGVEATPVETAEFFINACNIIGKRNGEIVRLKAEGDKWRDLFNSCSDDLGVALRQHEASKAERDAAMKEIEQIKTVEFPHKVEAVAQANFVRGLEAARDAVRTDGNQWCVVCRGAIQARIDAAKERKP